MKKLIINAGRIHLPEQRTNADTILIDDSRIAAIGTKEEFTREIRSGAEITDAEGAVVLPGFIDSHNHLMLTAAEKLKINLCGLHTKDEIFNHIHEKLKTLRDGSPILCCNLEYDYIPEDQKIFAEDIDRHFPGQEVQIEERTGHASVTNKYTLERAGIDWHYSGCCCPKDPTSFSGEICGKVNALVGKYIKSRFYTPDELESVFIKAGNAALSRGITGIHVMCAENDLETLCRFRKLIPIHLRIYTETKNVEKISRAGFRQIGGCGAVIVDGDTSPYTAAFFEPYTIAPQTKGILYYSDEELHAYVSDAHRHDMQIGLHCVGEAASDQLLRVYEKLNAEDPRPLRHRIEHFEFVDDDLIRRAAKADICLSVQPAFNHLWPHQEYIEDLGEKRALQADRVRSLVRSGIHVGFGSDSPVTPADPLLTIHSAVNHSNAKERIDPGTAIECHTIGSAYCGFEEKTRGSIELGKDADLVFLEKDPLTVPVETIKDIRVLRTMISGETVFTV